MQLMLLLVCLTVFTASHVVKTDECPPLEATLVTDSLTTAAVKTEESTTDVIVDVNKHEEIVADATNTVKIDETETVLPEIDITCDQLKIDAVTELSDGEKHETVEVDEINGVKTEENHEVNYEKSSEFSTERSSQEFVSDTNEGVETALEAAGLLSEDKFKESQHNIEDEIHDEQIKINSELEDNSIDKDKNCELQVDEKERKEKGDKQKSQNCFFNPWGWGSSKEKEQSKAMNEHKDSTTEDSSSEQKPWWESLWENVFPVKKPKNDEIDKTNKYE